MAINRRRFLKGASAGAGLLVAGPAIIRSGYGQQKLDIGGIYSMSGAFANVGTLLNTGSKLGVEAYGNLAGAALNYVLLDDQGDPGKAVRKAQEAWEQGMKHFVGCTLSSIALAAAKEIHRLGGVYVHEAGADEATGSECNRSSFRWPVASYGAVEGTVRPLIEQFPAAKRWYTITGQYVFGDSLLSNCKAIFAEKGIEHVGNSYHSLSEKEYSGYVTAAMAAKPDVLAICNFGNQTADVLRQAVSFGMKRNTKILVIWSTGLDQFQALGSDIIQDVYFGVQYWHDVKSDGNDRLVKIVKEKLNDVPNYLVACGYAVSQILCEGIKRANSTDVGAIIKAIEGMEYQGPTGAESVRAGDHQVIKDYYLMRGKAKSALKDKHDLAEIIKATKAFLPVEKTGCKMA